MKNLIIALAVLALVSSVAWAGIETRPAELASKDIRPTRNVTYFVDTMESGPGTWTTVDWTAVPQPYYWHVTSYLAHPGGLYSYFCGIEPPSGLPGDVNADGGYGNSWDQRLEIPAVDWTGAGYPLLSYSYRHDMEPGFDICMLQIQQGAVYVDAMAPDKVHTGISGGGASPIWVDQVGIGTYLMPYDNPMVARLRMTSDGGWSDADGDYDSQCGGIHVDNLKVWDYYYGGVYFTDDVEDGVGQCTYGVPPVTGVGDQWHLTARPCRAASSPTVWWCGDDADTSNCLPGLENGLITPDVDVSGAITCTMYYAFTIEFPIGGGDYGWKEFLYVDGLAYQMTYSWGDQCTDYGLGACNVLSWSTPDIFDAYLPATTMNYEWRILSDPVLGIPGGCGGSNMTIDDVWWYGQDVTSVEESSWGNIKAMYR